MEVGDLISEFRTATGDHGTPPLWPDKDVIRWLNEAQRQAAIRARLLRDFTTPEVVTINLLTGQTVYRLHPAVFDVDAVGITRADADGNPETRRRKVNFDCWCGTEDVVSHTARSGWPDTFMLYDDASGDGYSGISIVLDRTPSQDGGTLHLSVFRTQLEPLEFKTDEPEIAQQHHMGLVDWALFSAYKTRDMEGSARERAMLHNDLFTQTFGPMPTADVRRKQRRHRAPRCRRERW